MNRPKCSRCGEPLNDSVSGLTCPRCLLQAAFGSRERELCAEALKLSSTEERAAFLEGVCAEDAGLRERVEALLAAGTAVSAITEKDPLADARPDETEGQSFGRYKLLEKLGEGGFGAVWLAEQKVPVRRKVALKIIKLGMDTRAVVARFEAERQALAMMDHPNIAKVLDAGATEAGRPYFVMELVRGIRITDYCDQAQLSTRERLDLFSKVCQAIQHAHQKGIIHRDIKPSNILVTLHDGVPVPKVIDFGIAKATQGELTDKTIHTQFQQFIGTPAYISPEQAEMSGLDIDTRSDIFSLGVLLYELLVGSTPLDGKELLSQGVDAMRKTIREKEPVRPSTKLADLRPEELTTAAKRRSVEGSKLLHQLKGDLDWIVMKCLEKDRTRRYETANALVADIQRHLTNLPVTARPPSRLYTFQKTVRRHKLVFGAAAAVALTLLMGIVTSTWQAIRATHARDDAEQSRQGAQLARMNESEQRKRAEAEKERAEKSAAESRASLLQMTVANGVRLQAEGDYLSALLWFGRALGMADGSAQKMHRLRFTSVLQHCPRLLQVFAGTGWCEWAEFSPDGTKVLTGGDEHAAAARVWDAFTGEPVTPPLKQGSWRRMNCSFSPDGRRVVVPSFDYENKPASAQVFDASTGREITPPMQHQNWVVDARFSPDGHRVVTASFDHTARVWDAASGEALTPPLQHDGTLFRALFSPNGNFVLTASFDGTARLWDAATGREVIPPLRHEEPVNSAEFSPDGRRIVTASADRTARVWDTATGRQLGKPIKHAAAIVWACFSPDGTRILTGSADKTARVWDLETHGEVLPALPFFPNHDKFGHIPAFSPNGRWIASAASQHSAGLWDAATGQAVGPVLPHNADLIDAAFSPDSGRLVTVSRDTTARVWDLTVAENNLAPQWPALLINHLPRSSDGRRIIVSDASHNARVFDASTGVALSPAFAQGGAILSACFSPDGRRVLTTSSDNNARIWDVNGGQQIGRPLHHENQVLSGAFSADGTRVVTGCQDGTARIWNAETQEPVGPPLEHAGRFINAVHYAVFSADGRWIVTASENCAARVWDAATGKARTPPLMHEQPVNHAAFSPDGRLVASAGCDRTARVWDAETGEPVIVPILHNLAVLRVAFSADGLDLITQCADGAWVWRLPADTRPAQDLIRVAALVAGREIDQSGAITPLTASQMRTEWQALQAKYPGDSLLPRRAPPKPFQRVGPGAITLAPHSDLLEITEAVKTPLPSSRRDRSFPVDLSGKINGSLDENWMTGQPKSALSSLPRGRQEFGGTEFDLHGVVQVTSSSLKQYADKFPAEIKGFPVKRKAHLFHFLQTGHDFDARLGTYIVHYAGGRSWEIPVIGGLDTRFVYNQEGDVMEAPRSIVAWSGEAEGTKIRLYKTTWENPWPDLEIESIDLVSGMTWQYMTLFAITVE